MAGVINTGSFPKALWPGVNAWWGQGYAEDQQQYKMLFDITTSTKAYEEIVESIGMGLAPRKSEGSAVQYDSMQQGVVNRFTNVSYGLGFIVTREEKDDNQYEQLAMDRARDLGFSMRTTREVVGANFYNTAFTTTYGDGVALLSTAHPTKDGTQSNRLAVDADLSETSIEDLVIQIKKATDSPGRKIALQAKKLIIPSELEFEACRILKSVLQNDTANNAVNALKATGAISDGYAVNQYLTDADAWFIRSNAPKGMMWFDRTQTEFSDDNDFDTENMKAKAFMRFTTGFGDWRGLYGSAGA